MTDHDNPTPDDVQAAARKYRGVRVAVAIAAADWRGDDEAVAELWNGSDDHIAIIAGFAKLPALILTEVAADQGVEVDMDAWFAHVLQVLAREPEDL